MVKFILAGAIYHSAWQGLSACTGLGDLVALAWAQQAISLYRARGQLCFIAHKECYIEWLKHSGQ